MNMQAQNALIYTRSAHCRDCYKCLRNCPVTCISMNQGQAQVLNDSCIVCGACILNCPQKAKQYANNILSVEKLLRDGYKKTAVSLAPSFAANLDIWQQKRLASALRLLGFDYVFETAIAAYYTALESARYVKDSSRAYIHSSCPAAINYITKYKPSLASRIAPVVSPMTAHARIIKNTLGDDVEVIFIGPCVAKKDEAMWPEYNGLVSEVLTFEELFKMLENHKINLKTCDESGFDKPSFYKAQYYPLPEGILKTAGLSNDSLPKKLLSVDGPENVKNALENFERENCDIELLWCNGGCINGPVGIEDSLIKKRTNLINYAQGNKSEAVPEPLSEGVDLSASYRDKSVKQNKYSEQDIETMLKAMEKEKEEDRLNCGGCGYPTCRDKAIANLNGYAQKEMCMPYLRNHLHMQNNSILDSMPAGIVLLDTGLNIVQTNMPFNKLFRCADGADGQHISVFVDPHPFEKVLSGEVRDINWLTEYPQYNFKCRFLVYNLPDSRQLVGIFIPILSDEELIKINTSIKTKALEKARELLKHQIDTNQKIAKYLGESTAESQDIVSQIMQITSDNPKDEG